MNTMPINFAGPPGPGLTAEQQALVDQAIAVGEAVPNITTTSGEKLPLTSALNGTDGGAVPIIVGGRVVGYSIPIGQSGAAAYTLPRIPFSRAQAQRLKGCTIRIPYVMWATEGFLATTPFGGNAVRVDWQDGTFDGNLGVAMPAQQTGTRLTRDYIYVMTGEEAWVGGTLQIAPNSPTDAVRSFRVESGVYEVIATPDGTAATGADAVLDNRLGELEPNVDIFRAVAPNLSMAGGAQVIIAEDGREMGLSLAIGQTGEDSILQWTLKLTGALRAALARSQPRLTLEFVTHAGWDRAHTLNMQARKTNLSLDNDITTANVDNYQTIDRTTGQPTRRVMAFTFALPADLSDYDDLRAYIRLTDTTPASVAESIALTGYHLDIYRTAGDARPPVSSTSTLGDEVARAAAVDQAVATIAGTGQRVGAMLRASDFGSIAEALVSASAKASPGAMAVVDLEARTYYERNLGKITTGADGVLPGQDGANIILRGKGMGCTIIDGSLPANTDMAIIQATSTLDFNGSQYLENLTARAKNMRYPGHFDSVRYKNNIHLLWRQVELEHLGNDEADAYWGQSVWPSQHAYALGVTSGSYFGFYDCRGKGRRAAFSAHDQYDTIAGKGFDDPAIVEWVGGPLTAVDAAGWSYRLESIGSMVMNRALLADAPLGGEISMAVQPWMPTALDQQPADHRCWELTGRNNSPAAFRIQDFGRALRIKSLTTGTGSRIRVSGSLVPVLFGKTGTDGVTYVDGDVGLAGSAHGLVDIQETVGVGPASDMFITSLKARIGNRTSDPLAMTVEVDALPPVNITLNADYSAMTNAQIRAVLSAPLAGIAEVSEYAIGERYRPAIVDEERNLQNTSGTMILMGMALAVDANGARTVRPMTSADPVSSFAGVAWQDIRPGAHGRVKSGGWLPTTDLLRSDGGSPALDSYFAIDPAKPGYVLSGKSSGILRVVRGSLGAGLWTVAVETDQAVAQKAVEGEALARTQSDTAGYATPRVMPAHMSGGMMVLAEDANGAFFYADPVTGKVSLHNLVLDGGEGLIANGSIPLVRAIAGQPLMSFDLFDRRVIAEYGEVLGRPGSVDFDFLRVTEWDEAGQPLAGYEPGQRVRLHPRVLDGLTIQGDANKVPQLWAVVDSPNGPTRMKRQITYSQHGVTGYQVIQRPDGTTPGLIRIGSNDGDPIRDRHKVRHAQWHVGEPATAAPTKIVYVVVIGQSNSVGAGNYGPNPTGVKGPQTIRTAMPIRSAAFTSRLLTWNGGTIPYQGNLDGDALVGGVESSTIPIDAGRITSFVPMAEGLGAGAHAEGGATRESFVTALATHLNGPNGYDGSVYVASASFGFGSRSFAQLIHDGTNRMQPWLNALASIDNAKAIATAKSLTLEVHVLIDQGEADWSNASYRSQVEAAWAIMKGDITSRTAQAAAPQLFYHQTIQARGNFQEPAYSGLAQVELARNNADIHILPPHYFTDFDTDTIHYKAPEETWRGALSGEAMADWLIRGETAALMMQSATWAGTKMTVTMNHPVTRDAETISLTSGNGGLSHSNGAGTTVTISAALIDQTNPNKIVATMSAAIPAGAVETARMAYGNQATANPPSQGFNGGQRTVFKRADWRRYSMIDGRPLDIFATIQTLAATEEV
jgi:hypothetical protein